MTGRSPEIYEYHSCLQLLLAGAVPNYNTRTPAAICNARAARHLELMFSTLGRRARGLQDRRSVHCHLILSPERKEKCRGGRRTAFCMEL